MREETTPRPSIPKCEKCSLNHAPSGMEHDDGAACLAAQRQVLGFLMSRVGEIAKCGGCSQTIWWLVHMNGKSTPYNEYGQIHFVDCPNRDFFRKPK